MFAETNQWNQFIILLNHSCINTHYNCFDLHKINLI